MVYQPAIINSLNQRTTTVAVADVNNAESLPTVSALSATYQRYQRNLQRTAELVSEGSIEALKEQIDTFIASNTTIESEKVVARRAQIATAWLFTLQFRDPTITHDQMFHYSIVKTYLLQFLPTVVLMVRPRGGGDVIRSTTLFSYYVTIVELVIRMCEDPGPPRKRKGVELLTIEGFFQKLKAQVTGLTFEHDLLRTPHERLYFGRREVHIMISLMYRDTEHSALSRAAVIQTIARILLTFFATCRPSTLGYTEKKWREAGLFPKLSDVRIINKENMKYEILIYLTNFKCHINTIDAAEQRINLQSVQKSHNVFFDPTIYFLALFFVRKDFKKKYLTIDDLLNDTSPELELDPERKGHPLFQVPDRGGVGFKVPPEAAAARAATDAVRHWSAKSGLPTVGVTALRRDAADSFAESMGVFVAQSLLNHTEAMGTTSGKHYQRTTANVNLTGVILGEVAGSAEKYAGEARERLDAMHAYQSVAIDCLLRRGEISSKVFARAQKKARAPAIASAPQVLEIDSNVELLYAQYRQCFDVNTRANLVKANLANVNKIWNAAMKVKALTHGTISFKPEKNDQALQLRQELVNLFKSLTNVRRALNRKDKRQTDKEYNKSLKSQPLLGTAEERNTADVHLSGKAGPSKEVHDAYIKYESENGNGKKKLWSDAQAALENHGRTNLESSVDEDEEELDDIPPPFFNFLNNNPNAAAAGLDINLEEGEDDLRNQPDVDESAEKDVLTNLPVEGAKRALLRKLLEPIIDQIEARTIQDKECYPCQVCESRDIESVEVSPAMHRRHMLYNHSLFAEMAEKMLRPNSDKFHCPAKDGYSFTTAKKCFNHMLRDDCTNVEEHVCMYVEHEAAIREYHQEEIFAKPVGVVDDEELLKKLGDIFDELKRDKGAELLDDEAPAPVVVSPTMPNWGSLVGDLEFVGMSLEDFKSEKFDSFDCRQKQKFTR